MAYTTPATYTTNQVVTAANLNQDIRDNEIEIVAALHGDTSSDTDVIHAHKNGTLANLPAASLAGRRYFATDLGVEFIDTGSFWHVATVIDSIAESFKDDFFWNFSLPSAWHDFSTNGSITTVVSGSSYIRLDTTLGITRRAGITTPHALNKIYTTARVPALLQFRAKISSAARTNGETFIGLIGNTDAVGTSLATSVQNRIGFQKHDTGTEADWQSVCSNGTGPSVQTISGFKDATYHTFQFRINSSGNVTFYVDHVLKTTHTTIIPSGAMRIAAYIDSTANQQNSIDIDNVLWVSAR